MIVETSEFQGNRKEFDNIGDFRYDWLLFEDGSGSVSLNGKDLASFDLQTREVNVYAKKTGWIYSDVCTFKDVKIFIYNILGVDVEYVSN